MVHESDEDRIGMNMKNMYSFFTLTVDLECTTIGCNYSVGISHPADARVADTCAAACAWRARSDPRSGWPRRASPKMRTDFRERQIRICARALLPPPSSPPLSPALAYGAFTFLNGVENAHSCRGRCLLWLWITRLVWQPHAAALYHWSTYIATGSI